jgi:hypothetical protein
MRNVYRIIARGDLKIRNHLRDLVVDGKIILKLMIKKQNGRVLDKFIWLRVGSGHKIV